MKTTHVGSLPFKDTQKAMSFTLSFDLPVLFTLPQKNKNEFMLEHAYSILEKKQSIPYQEEFFGRVKGQYKYQLAGPITLEKNFDYSKPLSKILKKNEKMIFFLDEPKLNYASKEDLNALQVLVNNLKSDLNIQVGLHVCCAIKQNIIDLLEVDFFNLDYEINQNLRGYNSAGLGLNSMATEKFELITPSCGLALKNESECVEIKNFLDQYRDKYSRL